MNPITVSAPGKLMLFGEHAVVYGRPCLVTAVDQRMNVIVDILDTEEFQLEAPDVNVSGYKKNIKELGQGDIPKGAKFVEIAVKNVFDFLRHPGEQSASRIGSSLNKNGFWTSQNDDSVTGLKITTSSEFSSQFGFGSSSASTVCTIKAVSELMDLQLSEKDIFDLAYKTVLEIQGKGSGFDVAAVVWGGTLHFVKGGELIQPLNLKDLPLIVGYSRIKADTVTLINQVNTLAEKYPELIEETYNSIEDVVMFAKTALLDNNWESAGQLMNMNQGFLSVLGVSTKKLEEMIYGVRVNGGYGAKLSGAGGGDCMIALASDEKRKAVEDGIIQAGGEVIQVKANAEGVRIEQ